LADPFQLMHMAQTDMAGLQDELIKSSKAAFTFNKATGGFDASTQDLYKLREMAKITGQNIDDMVESGREAAKLDYISSKFSLDGLSEEQQGLVASLAQIDKEGNVKIDIPGFEENNRNLEDLMKDDGFKTALDQYQLDQTKSEKEIALAQMTISDKQLAAQNTIKEAVIASMGTQGTRDKFLKDIAEGSDKLNTIGVKTAGDAAPVSATGAELEAEYQNKTAGATEQLAQVYTTEMQNELQKTIKELRDKIANAPVETEDLFLGANNSVPKVMSKGTLYKGIVGDEVAMGTNLSDAINQGGGGRGGSGGGTVDGKIDININLTGAISGDKNSDVEKIFNDPRVQKQIMDTVLYKLDSYKRQQGVLS
jgi:hypothetical protein